MSIAMFLKDVAFGTSRSLVAKLFKDDGLGSLGFLIMTFVFGFHTIGSFFSVAMINKINRIGTSLSIGSLGFTIFVASCILPALMANVIQNDPEHRIPDSGFLSRTPITLCFILSSFACGIGSGIFWTAEGAFVGKAACEEN